MAVCVNSVSRMIVDRLIGLHFSALVGMIHRHNEAQSFRMVQARSRGIFMPRVGRVVVGLPEKGGTTGSSGK